MEHNINLNNTFLTNNIYRYGTFAKSSEEHVSICIKNFHLSFKVTVKVLLTNNDTKIFTLRYMKDYKRIHIQLRSTNL